VGEESPLSIQRALAERLDCIIEDDLATLANVLPSTVIDWRRRGAGPPYVKLGNTVLYPCIHLAAYLHAHVRGGISANEPAIL
jgi:hypothetical protein